MKYFSVSHDVAILNNQNNYVRISCTDTDPHYSHCLDIKLDNLYQCYTQTQLAD